MFWASYFILIIFFRNFCIIVFYLTKQKYWTNTEKTNNQNPFLLIPIPIIRVTPLFPSYSTISKYLICMAALVSSNYADCFINEAV